jgi:hypothetical protein
MKKREILLFLLLILLCVCGGNSKASDIKDFTAAGRPAKIYPDYSSITFPSNIAPLNFIVEEKGSDFFVKIHAGKGEPIELTSRTGKIEIPEYLWHRLIENNINGEVKFEIYVKDEKQK